MNRDQIRNIAMTMAEEAGLINLSRKALCDRAGIPDGSFPHIMGCNFTDFIEELKGDLMPSRTGPVTKSRANPTLRRDQILNVALTLAAKKGYQNITRDGIAEKAGVSMGLVTRYFGTMNQLKIAVMRAAVKRGIAEIVAQGLANGDSHAKKASAELKAKAATLLVNF